jgi:hypothetical protein
MRQILAVAVAQVVVFACAVPTQEQAPPRTENGPGVDLGSFIGPADDPSDVPSAEADFSSATDFSSPADSSSPPDFSTFAADLSSSSSCGSITSAGICVGNIRKYCDATGVLRSVDCMATGRECFISSGNAVCLF